MEAWKTLSLTAQVVVAIETNRPDILRHALSKGASPDAMDRGTPALVMAASRQLYDIAKVLLDAGATPDLRQQSSNISPLYAAVFNHDARMAELLVQRGADPHEARMSHHVPSPIMLAALQNNLELVCIMTRHVPVRPLEGEEGNEADVVANGHFAVIRHLWESGCPIGNKTWFRKVYEGFAAADDKAIVRASDFLRNISSLRECLLRASFCDAFEPELRDRIRRCKPPFLEAYAQLGPAAEDWVLARRMHDKAQLDKPIQARRASTNTL